MNSYNIDFNWLGWVVGEGSYCYDEFKYYPNWIK